ncbi:hypothetical protein LTR10_005718 [Elasticomyces elasticus]|nr:hypothetical protein LTR10_005718 [Elasticomyces elasticus]KAK4964925.1 hypothetical protein LTR42_012342 [Elasticomyces elasticus]
MPMHKYTILLLAHPLLLSGSDALREERAHCCPDKYAALARRDAVHDVARRELESDLGSQKSQRQASGDAKALK